MLADSTARYSLTIWGDRRIRPFASAACHVAGEQHATAVVEEERGMSLGVTWGVEGSEARHRYRAVRGQPLVHRNLNRLRHDGRHDAHESPLSRVGPRAGDHRCIDRMSHDSSAGPATQLCHVADVVGMPMRQQDGVHSPIRRRASSMARSILSARRGSPVSTSTTPSSTTTAKAFTYPMGSQVARRPLRA